MLTHRAHSTGHQPLGMAALEAAEGALASGLKSLECASATIE